jgi:hypothetical protein
VFTARVHRPTAPDAHRGDAGAIEPVDQIGHHCEERVGIKVELRRCIESCTEGAVVLDDSRRQLGPADIDRNDVGHKGGG